VLGKRCMKVARTKRSAILGQLMDVTGYHRKQAIRCLRKERSSGVRRRRPRIYDAAVEQALRVFWETSDRLCGKHLRAIPPILVETA